MTQSATTEEQFLDSIADGLSRRGWRLPALAALEAGRPFAFVGGQLLWLSQPVLSLFIPKQMIDRTARLLEEPESIDALVGRLNEEAV